MEGEDIELEEIQDEATDEGFQHPYEGEILMSWMIDEYHAHERGALWYGAAITLGFGLLIYAIVTQNFLFAVMIVMFGVLIGLSSLRHPEKIPFVITDLGIGIGDRFIQYKQMKSFWMIYEPPEVKTLYVELRQTVTPHLMVPIEDQNPLDIRAALGRIIPENHAHEEESFMDWLSRFLKI